MKNSNSVSIKAKCIDCGKQLGYGPRNLLRRCKPCRFIAMKTDPSLNSMYGKKQDCTKFRKTHPNVNYEDFIIKAIHGKNKKLYRVKCEKCGADRGYQFNSCALGNCILCYPQRLNKKTPEHNKIYSSMKSNINVRLKHRSVLKQRGVFRFLPYTMYDLMRHLEAQFEPWMNWENHGAYSPNRVTWQIDHIIPDSKFTYSSINDMGFKESWSLSNLRPLNSLENILKSNK